MQQVLALEPDHVQAKAEMARLQVPSASPIASRSAPMGRLRRWGLPFLVVAAALFLFVLLGLGPVDRSLAGLLPAPTPTSIPTPTLTPAEIATQFDPQLQAALANEDWDRALEIVTIMLNVDPTGEQTKTRALEAHMQHGRFLVQTGQSSEALAEFDQAVALVADDAQAQLWQQVTKMYLDGREALDAGNWPEAIQILTQAHERMPDYGDLSARVLEAHRRQGLAAIDVEDWTAAIRSFTQAREWSPDDPDLVDLLATAYRQRGITWQEQGELQDARTDLETALALRPGDEQAQTHYDEVMYILFPPKRIEINISTQKFYAWQGDQLIYSFPTSTGLRGRDTKAGHFRVQSKIPMAYSSIWRLQMPYWLGIYWVGNIENGIHALPIRPDGSVMWGGLLGQRASYGCVILSNAAARLIYEWVDIGTAVDIHY